MNVAIIGMGVSGLSCAYRLNQLGVRPTMFERKSIVGESINLFGIHLNCFNNISKNPLRFLEKKYGLSIKPLSSIREINMRAGKKEVNIKGRLGYIFKRGAERTSLERQLYDQIDADIYLDAYIIDTHLDEIRKRFDYVIIATGETDIPDFLGIWHEASVKQIRSGIMDGNYNTERVILWLNREYADKAYIYLVPASQNRAAITMTVSDITPNELDYYWKRMLIAENISNNILETWDFEFHSGTIKTNQFGNLFFIGNAGGMTDDFMGFGIMNGISGGIIAAESIVQGKNFEKGIITILRQTKDLHCLRMLFDKMDNRTLHAMTTVLGLPGIRHAVYNYQLLHIQKLGRMAGAIIKNRKNRL